MLIDELLIRSTKRTHPRRARRAVPRGPAVERGLPAGTGAQAKGTGGRAGARPRRAPRAMSGCGARGPGCGARRGARAEGGVSGRLDRGDGPATGRRRAKTGRGRAGEDGWTEGGEAGGRAGSARRRAGGQRQTDRETEGQTDREREADRQGERQTDREREADRQGERDRPTGRQRIDRQEGRQPKEAQLRGDERSPSPSLSLSHT